MQILLAAATSMEVEPFIQQRPLFDFLVTGVGSPAAVYQLTKRLHQIDYDLVIQAGIAGRFGRELALGEVVAVKQDCFADLGVFEKRGFHTLFELGFDHEDHFPYTGGWLENNGTIINSLAVRKVKAITVNTITDEDIVANRMKSKFDPGIESMEGAALHYVCLQENIPFLQIRSISNDVGERDKTKWKMQEALSNLNEALTGIINKLSGAGTH